MVSSIDDELGRLTYFLPWGCELLSDDARQITVVQDLGEAITFCSTTQTTLCVRLIGKCFCLALDLAKRHAACLRSKRLQNAGSGCAG